MNFKKNVTRPCSVTDIQIWDEGQSTHLKKRLGFGFFNTIYESKNEMVTLYYEESELKAFEQVLDEGLTEELFDELCDEFFKLIERSKEATTPEEKVKILAKCWPALTIFDVISKYPEYAVGGMLQRLIRVRTATESFHYELSQAIPHEKLSEDYIFFKGAIHKTNISEFLAKQGFVVTGTID